MPELGKDLSIVNGVLLAEKLNDFTEMGDLELAFVRNSLLTNEKAKDLLASYISADDRSARITFRIIDSFENINRNVLLEKIASFQITSYIFNCIIYSSDRSWVCIFFYEHFFNSFRHNDNNYRLYICWYVS